MVSNYPMTQEATSGLHSPPTLPTPIFTMSTDSSDVQSVSEPSRPGIQGNSHSSQRWDAEPFNHLYGTSSTQASQGEQHFGHVSNVPCQWYKTISIGQNTSDGSLLGQPYPRHRHNFTDHDPRTKPTPRVSHIPMAYGLKSRRHHLTRATRIHR